MFEPNLINIIKIALILVLLCSVIILTIVIMILFYKRCSNSKSKIETNSNQTNDGLNGIVIDEIHQTNSPNLGKHISSSIKNKINKINIDKAERLMTPKSNPNQNRKLPKTEMQFMVHSNTYTINHTHNESADENENVNELYDYHNNNKQGPGFS